MYLYFSFKHTQKENMLLRLDESLIYDITLRVYPIKEHCNEFINLSLVADVQIDQNSQSTKPADFEEAIGATRYGAFNFILLLAGLPCCIATVYETSTMSYVVPSAECDLKLSLMDKGVLNAITYAGNWSLIIRE